MTDTVTMYYPIMNLTHSNQTVHVLLAGYQYSYYTVAVYSDNNFKFTRRNLMISLPQV